MATTNLTREEKAKRYDEAIEIARQIHDADRVSGIELTTCEEIFPELKESEDERIRKELVKVFSSRKEYLENPSFGILTVEEILAWLEKQGEQKSADKVEPKFKVGDWIVNNADADCKYYVERVGNGVYHARKGTALVLISFIEDEYYHLWTIQDAKAAEWSEEDERLFQIVIDILDRQNNLGNISRTDLIACVRKLKSLRPQTTWKPSDEQMDILGQYIKQNNFDGKILTSLYEDLKKLREE